MQTSYWTATLRQLRKQFRACGNAKDARALAWFFKTGPGEYAEGDVFLGIRVPAVRRFTRAAAALGLGELKALLHSKYHEERLLALLGMVRVYEKGDGKTRAAVVDLYLGNTKHINNWDLVDLSAPNILGNWLLDRPRGLLESLAGSASLWERRIAVLSTFALIRKGQFEDALRVCRLLLCDPHDLIHKACGWMLREVGKRDEKVLESFLEAHSARMPRTMLRYAIERMPEARRKGWLQKPSDSRKSRP